MTELKGANESRHFESDRATETTSRNHMSSLADLASVRVVVPATERLAKRDHVFDAMSPAFIECNDVRVRPTNLKIQLRAPQFEQPHLRPIHEKTREALPAKFGKHSEVMDPTPNAIESG